MLNVLKKYDDIVFVSNISEIKTLKFEPYSVRLKPNATPKRCPPYSVPHDAQLWLKDTIDQLMALDKIEPSKSAWAAGTVLIPADISKRHKRKRQKYKGAAPNVTIQPIPPAAKPPLKNSRKIYNTVELETTRDETENHTSEDHQVIVNDLYRYDNYNLAQHMTDEPSDNRKEISLKGYTAIPSTRIPATTTKDPYRL
ncbi:hypothetical protein G6F62_012085 [Rhizopus arrhizus]|nr:hypothetical protein G6F62_012085 [Rhizopus arrhizus]